jgi:integrase
MHIKDTHGIVQGALKALGLPTFKEGTHTIRRAVAMAYFQEVAKDKGDVAALRETAAFLHHSSVATTELYLGMTPEKNRRDRRLRGQPFLSAMVAQDNVVQLRPTATGE